MEKLIPYLWIIFGIFTIIHLLFCFFEKEKARKVSKCFIMPALIFILAMYGCKNIYVYLGASFGFLGDVLIIFKKRHIGWMAAGSISFLIGHIFYMLRMYEFTEGFIFYDVIVLACIFLLLLFIGWVFASKKLGKLTIIGILYFTFLVFMIFIAIRTDVTMIALAAIVFCISDVVLCLTNFVKTEVRKKELFVMSTYILAQVLMIISLK